jgi:F0F1-type ATP synthase delta subunit
MVSNLNLAYASVLFDVGQRQKRLPAFLDMAQEILHVFKHNPKLSEVLNDLSVEKEDRKKLVGEI